MNLVAAQYANHKRNESQGSSLKQVTDSIMSGDSPVTKKEDGSTPTEIPDSPSPTKPKKKADGKNNPIEKNQAPEKDKAATAARKPGSNANTSSKAVSTPQKRGPSGSSSAAGSGKKPRMGDAKAEEELR